MTRRTPSPQSHFSALSFLTLLLLPLGALAETERQTYSCDNGSRLDISFVADDGRPQAVLHFADGTVTLPQVPAASGAQYRNETVRLHTRGDEALFQDDKGNLRRCSRSEALTGQSPAITAPAAASSFIDIAGRIGYRQRVALPADAVLIVRVQDVPRAGRAARTLAEQRIELAGRQVPIPFRATIDRDLIGKPGRVAVVARIEHDGRPRFVSDRPYPALQDGRPVEVDIELKQVGGASAR